MIWHSDDLFWKTFAPFMFGQARWAATPGEVDALLKLAPMPPGARILDLCCGPGRHSLELARRGYNVVGVDRTARFIAEARKRAKREKLKVEFVARDMRRFCRPGAFDVVFNLFTAFGYFRKPEDDRRVLLSVHRSLKPGGALVMDLMSKEILAGRFRERDWHEDHGAMFLEERKLSQDWSWIDTRWILIKGSRRCEFRVSHRLYSAKELADLLRSCGFTRIRAFGNLSGAPYDHAARRLVMLARRP